MLSRAAILGQNSRALVALATRATGTSASTNLSAQAESKNEPEFRRIVRQEPGKVRYAFIPEEWFQMFYKKTGVTGPYTFFVTFSTYLVSKEIYVLEHEYYTGLALLVMWGYGISKFGPKVAAFLDKEVDNYEKQWNESRVNEKKLLEEQVSDEEKAQWCMEGQNLLLEAKRENVALQYEANYRQRLQHAFAEVKKRLDFQVDKSAAERRISQKNLVEYVVAKVKASITPDQEKQNINKCIADLALLAKV